MSANKSICVKHQIWLLFSVFIDLFPTQHKVAHNCRYPNFYELLFNKTQLIRLQFCKALVREWSSSTRGGGGGGRGGRENKNKGWIISFLADEKGVGDLNINPV